jgi:hypothetical protein
MSVKTAKEKRILYPTQSLCESRDGQKEKKKKKRKKVSRKHWSYDASKKVSEFIKGLS